MKEKKYLIIIPARNEEGRIEKVIREIKRVLPEADILVINDASTDRTEQVSLKEGAKVINLPFNLGYGVALQTGYKYAVRYGYSGVVQLDGDGQHDPSFIPDFLRILERGEADLVIGSRFLTRRNFKGSFLRRIGIIFFAKLTSIIIGQKITDPISGYQAMNRKVVEFCTRDFYPFDYPDADILILLHRAGFKIKETPVVMRERTGGVSLHSGLKPFYYIFKMMLSVFVTVLRKNPGLYKKGE